MPTLIQDRRRARHRWQTTRESQLLPQMVEDGVTFFFCRISFSNKKHVVIWFIYIVSENVLCIFITNIN